MSEGGSYCGCVCGCGVGNRRSQKGGCRRRKWSDGRKCGRKIGIEVRQCTICTFRLKFCCTPNFAFSATNCSNAQIIFMCGGNEWRQEGEQEREREDSKMTFGDQKDTYQCDIQCEDDAIYSCIAIRCGIILSYTSTTLQRFRI